MPRERLTMRKVKEVLRLKWASGCSVRQIAASCGIGRATVSDYLRRAEVTGLHWPLSEGLDEATWSTACFRPLPAYWPNHGPSPSGRIFTGNASARA